MSRFLSHRFDQMEAYVPGEQSQDHKYVRLNTNESPYPPSPLVLERLQEEETLKLNRYPDYTARSLREKLAALYGVTWKNIILTNGSDDALNLAFMAFCDKEHGVAFPEISYGFYPVYGDLYGLEQERIPLKEDFSICVEDYFHTGKMTVLANPNAPTGLSLPLEEIRRIAEQNKDQVVLIDEAYVDFGGNSAASMTKEYENLLVVQTFSKSRSLAGGRLGFAIGKEELIKDMELLKFSTNPYSINRMTLAAGEAAIDSNEYYMENARKIVETREETKKCMEKLGFEVLDSRTNFLFARHAVWNGGLLYEELKKKDVLVRHFKKEKIDPFIRVTIGSPEEMKIFLEKLKEVIKEQEENR